MNSSNCVAEMKEANELAVQYLGRHREVRTQMDCAPNEERLKMARSLREIHALYKEQLLRYLEAQSIFTSLSNQN